MIFSRRRVTTGFRAVAVGAVLVLLPATPALAGTGIPPCLNYVHEEQYGHVTADTRWVGSDPIGTVSWLWSIDVISDRPGPYTWQIFINDKASSGSNSYNMEIKDDNVHSAFRRVDNGNARYTYGDTFQVQAIHEAPDGKTVYLAIYNKCYIASH